MLKRLAIWCSLLCSSSFAATTVSVAPDKDTGVYDLGAKVKWTVTVMDEKTPASGKVSWVLKKGGLDEIGKGDADLADGKATIEGTREDPGVLLLSLKVKGADGAPVKNADGKEVSGLGGAVFAWEKIKPSQPAPDDFDAFWKEKIAQLKAIPMNVQVTPVEQADKTVEYFKITMDNINGRKIYGHLAKPAGKENLPAQLMVQYAGVYGLAPKGVIDQAKQGWLALNIIAHDLPIDEKPEFYKAKAEKELKDYAGQGGDDREKSYFLPMFLSCYRAADYLTERPDWNKKSLLVIGGSQGGYQALVTAGFHPAITSLAANVPAGCDHTGKSAHRLPGWPNWGRDDKKRTETGRYFDAMNFAARAKVPAFVGIGLIDTVCPPEGCFAAANALQGEKQVIIMPRAGHGGEHNAYYGKLWQFMENQKKK